MLRLLKGLFNFDMSNKKTISQTFRRLGLLKSADRINFYIEFIKHREQNKKFLLKNPEVKLPPDYIMYESFQLDYESYFDDGMATAEWLIVYLRRYVRIENKKILDWGCGPARIVRHMPSLLVNCEFHGTDYNKTTIEWCQKNIKDVVFHSNEMLPPTIFKNSFDIIYGISVFTHLSEENHYNWIEELYRILGKNGILFFTAHGKAFISKLNYSEQNEFNKGNLIVKSNTKEGHRTYGAYHPPLFIHSLIKNFELLVHSEGKIKNTKPEQDIWIVRKK